MSNLIKPPDENDFAYQNKRQKIFLVDYNQGIKLIYQWVKNGEITLKIFNALIDQNNLKSY